MRFLESLARSRQVYIELVVEALLVICSTWGGCRRKETPIGRVPVSYDIAGPCPAEVQEPVNCNRNTAC